MVSIIYNINLLNHYLTQKIFNVFFQSKNIFSKLKKIIGDDFPRPLVYILSESGFDSDVTLRTINSDSIQRIEDYFNSSIETLKNGLLGSAYENMRPFKILPGYRNFIESLPTYLEQFKGTKSITLTSQVPASFSCILKMLIETAEINSERNSKGNQK